MSLETLLLVALLSGATFYGIGIYNALVAARNRFRNAFAQIDVQLRRRHDLVPNLVSAAKAYMAHERETLEGVMQARQQASQAAEGAAARPADAQAMAVLASAEGALGAALGRFYAVAEAYPELKADASIGTLMSELSGSENLLAAARRAFNDAVTDYNNRREQFPANLVAGMFAFTDAALYAVEAPAVREAPRVSFD